MSDHSHINVSAGFEPGRVRVREFCDSGGGPWVSLEFESWGSGRGLTLAVYLEDAAQVDEMETALHAVREHLSSPKATSDAA